jgi:predicted patatin/cPLA2 family phospholipase
VEGGAMRGVFTTGILDGFLENGFNPFDLYLGVSAGACNLAAYLAEMPGRNFRIYSDYALRPEFFSVSRFLKGGHLMDLDWLWAVTIAEIRLDLLTIYKKEKPFIAVLTDKTTGEAIYHDTTADTLEHVLKATSAMPVFYRNTLRVDGRPTTDGGLADSIPIQKAISMGAKKILVIRSRPYSYVKKTSALVKAATACMPVPGSLKTAILSRDDRYNRTLDLLRQPPEDVRMIEIAPPEDFPVSRLGRNRRSLEQGYEIGIKAAGEAMRRWNEQACPQLSDIKNSGTAM